MSDSARPGDDRRDDVAGSGSGDDYTPSASWETSRGSSWENTTPYESPWAPPRSAGSAPGSGAYDPASSGSGGSSAVERPREDGPWPTYPEPAPVDDDPPAPTYGTPAYGTPTYGTPSPYGQPTGYPSPPVQGGYAQPAAYGQPPAYPVNPYQQPAYGSGYAMPSHPQATTALVLGILGLALCPFVGIGAFILGGRARREIDAAPGQWAGRGVATAGWVLGILSIVYAALVVVYVIVAVAAGVSS